MYSTVEEANQKLAGTVVFYKNRPIRVIEAVGRTNIAISGYTLPTATTDTLVRCELADKDLDIRRLGSRLGYLNWLGDSRRNLKPQAMFLSRVAHRRSHQGLCSDNVDIPRGEAVDSGQPSSRPDFQTLEVSQEFIDSVTNKFPSLKDCVAILVKNNKWFSHAFHKFFCVRKPEVGPFYLVYKGSDIGWSEDGERYKLAERVEYLKDELVKIEGMRVYA